MSDKDPLYAPPAAGGYISTAPNTMAGWRSLGTGPTFCKIGGRVYYRKSDLDDWIASRRVSSTAEARALPKQSRVRDAERSGAEGAVA